MRLFYQQTVKSPLPFDEITLRLVNSKHFEGIAENTQFTIKEKSLLSNKFLFPTIEGFITTQENCSNILLFFKVSRCDKIALSMFLLGWVLIAALLGAFSGDILVLSIVFLWCASLAMVFLLSYTINCRRALEKIRLSLDSKTS